MKKAAVAIALLLASIALVACGGSSSDTTSEPAPKAGAPVENKAEEEGGATAGGGTVSFEADPGGQLAYTTTSASSEAGEVTIDFKNPQAVPHDVTIEDSSGEVIGQTELVSEGEGSASVDLKPGKYTFFCSVTGHREAGMEGTLTVK
jgi:uncharacterized cupredoxin-like copper-binding protein